jgi:hypothetical protein
VAEMVAAETAAAMAAGISWGAYSSVDAPPSASGF